MNARISGSQIGAGTGLSGRRPLVYATFFAALLIQAAGAGLAASPGVAVDRQHNNVCHLAPKYLPRTPDAVEGWLHNCPSR